MLSEDKKLGGAVGVLLIIYMHATSNWEPWPWFLKQYSFLLMFWETTLAHTQKELTYFKGSIFCMTNQNDIIFPWEKEKPSKINICNKENLPLMYKILASSPFNKLLMWHLKAGSWKACVPCVHLIVCFLAGSDDVGSTKQLDFQKHLLIFFS